MSGPPANLKCATTAHPTMKGLLRYQPRPSVGSDGYLANHGDEYHGLTHGPWLYIKGLFVLVFWVMVM
jgi:hypothetical protein